MGVPSHCFKQKNKYIFWKGKDKIIITQKILRKYKQNK